MVLVQASARSFLVRCRLSPLRHAAVILCSCARGFLARAQLFQERTLAFRSLLRLPPPLSSWTAEFASHTAVPSPASEPPPHADPAPLKRRAAAESARSWSTHTATSHIPDQLEPLAEAPAAVPPSSPPSLSPVPGPPDDDPADYLAAFIGATLRLPHIRDTSDSRRGYSPAQVKARLAYFRSGMAVLADARPHQLAAVAHATRAAFPPESPAIGSDFSRWLVKYIADAAERRRLPKRDWSRCPSAAFGPALAEHLSDPSRTGPDSHDALVGSASSSAATPSDRPSTSPMVAAGAYAHVASLVCLPPVSARSWSVTSSGVIRPPSRRST